MSSVPSPPADAAQQRPLMLALLGAIFVVFIDTRVVAALLPDVARSFTVTVPRAGLLISAYAVPYGLFQLLYGPIADRIGKVRVILVAMVVFSVGTVACGLTDSFALMIALRAITGAAAAAVFPLTLAYVGDTVPYERRQATIAMLVATTGMASSVSTVSGAVVAKALSWQWVFPVFGVLGAIFTIQLFAVAKREHRVPAPKVSAGKAYALAIKSRPLMALVALSFIEGSLYFGGFSYLGSYLTERFELSILSVGALLSCTGIAQLIAARFVPRLVRRFGEPQLVALGGFGMSLALLTVAIAPWWYTFPLSMLLLGAGFSLCHSTLQTRASEALPGMRGTAIALFAFALFLGNGLGTLAVGELLAVAGYRSTLLTAGLCFLAFTWAAVVAIVRTSSRPAKA